VLLAAGASRRLGSPKALASLREGPGGTALELLLAAGAALGDPAPLVVTGADHAAIAARVRDVELVRNDSWEAGRSGSVRCAARARPGRDLCLAPVDVPLVPAAVFAALGLAWEQAGCPARGWLAPFLAGTEPRRHGHPVLLGRGLCAGLKDFPPDRPLRALRASARPSWGIAVASAAILDDLDTPEDLARLRAGLA